MSDLNREPKASVLQNIVEAKRQIIVTSVNPQLTVKEAAPLPKEANLTIRVPGDPHLNLLRFQDLTASIREYLVSQKVAIDRVFDYFDIEGNLKDLCKTPFDKMWTEDPRQRASGIPTGGRVYLFKPEYYDQIVNPNLGVDPSETLLDGPLYHPEIVLPISVEDYSRLQKTPLRHFWFSYERVTEGKGNHIICVGSHEYTQQIVGKHGEQHFRTWNEPIYKTRLVNTSRAFRVRVLAESEYGTPPNREYSLKVKTNMEVRRNNNSRRGDFELLATPIDASKTLTLGDRPDAFQDFLAEQLVKLDP